MLNSVSRTLLMYVILLISIRLLGKRQVGQIEVSELAVTFMLTELAVIPISETSVSVLSYLIPIIVLLAVEYILSLIISRSATVKALIAGKPTMIIQKGKIDKKSLSKLRMSMAELLGELRQQGVSSVEEVNYAILEGNGKLSVFKYASTSPATPEQMSLKAPEAGISHCLIIEGVIYKNSLAFSGKSETWLYNYLRKKNTEVKDVFLLSVDDSDKITFLLKDKKQSSG